jgi:ribokinase
MRVAVLGHVEWVDFLRVPAVPLAGEIVHAVPLVAVPAGGGGVAAVALATWAGTCELFTALGDNELGTSCDHELRKRGVTVHAALRAEPQRRAVTLIDAHGERTIIVAGARLVASRSDHLPWDAFSSIDAVYITGGDADAVRAARAARIVVGTSRVVSLFRESGIALDALVGSDNDPAETYAHGDLDPAPKLVVRTAGERGGTYTLADGTRHTYAAVPTQVTGDTYGAGDTFAAALTFALGEGRTPADAIVFAAGQAARVLAFTGPYS